MDVLTWGAPPHEARAILRPDGQWSLRLPGDTDSWAGLLTSPPAGIETVVLELEEGRAEELLESLGFVATRTEQLWEVPVAGPGRRAVSSPDHHLVRVTDCDLTRVTELDNAVRAQIPGTEGWVGTVADLRVTLDDDEFDPDLYLIAVHRGTGRYDGLVRVWDRAPHPRLGCVGVRPQWRRTRLGPALIGAVTTTLRQRGVTHLVTDADVTNRDSQLLAAHHGAVPRGRTVEWTLRRPASDTESRHPPRGHADPPGHTGSVHTEDRAMADEDLLHRARTVAQVHADLLERELGPDRVRAVWLVGSAMLQDLTGASDIDAVTLTDTAFGGAEHEALARVHAALAERFPGVSYDTTYLSQSLLAEPPQRGTVVPQSIDGQLVLDQPGGEVHAVTWFTLPHALRVTGAYPREVAILADQPAALAHTQENLQSYWVDGLVPQLRQLLDGRPADQRLEHPDVVVWTVLGAPRLAAFLDPTAEYAGPIPAKSEAAAWVVAHRPQYAELAQRALAARAGADVDFTVSDALRAADLVESLT